MGIQRERPDADALEQERQPSASPLDPEDAVESAPSAASEATDGDAVEQWRPASDDTDDEDR